MESRIKTIEDLSLNAWPSHQMQLYDGWILRFSYFYTHRTNSVEQIGPSLLPLPEKVNCCEEIYRRWGTPCIFKISPLVSSDFDIYLEEHGYAKEHVTHVMTRSLNEGPSLDPEISVSITNFIPSKWIEGLFALKGTTNIMHRTIVPSMYRAIPKETICASVSDSNGRIIATGLGILDRNYIGLYAIHVHPDYRKRGYARSICQAILRRGRSLGAVNSYLQVVQGNDAAIHLYRSLGYQHLYTYWFRAKSVTGYEDLPSDSRF